MSVFGGRWPIVSYFHYYNPHSNPICLKVKILRRNIHYDIGYVSISTNSIQTLNMVFTVLFPSNCFEA